MKKINLYRIGFLLAFMGCALAGRAQLNPFQSMFYQNRYLLNPALAGSDQGLHLNLNYKQQWSSFPGMPKTTSLTGDFQAGEKVGVGLNLNDDQAGPLRSTRVVGSYAYHLPLSDRNDHLNFGLSLGFADSRVDYSKVNGDISDNEITQYNQLKPYVDGDFGVAYTSDKLMISGTVPNLKSTVFKSSDERFDADMLMFVGAASYKFDVSSTETGMILEPLAAFRMVKGYKNIVDAGFNFMMNNYGMYLQGIYHTNQNMSVGIGFDQKSYLLNFDYNIETGQLNTYTQGAFELGIKINLFKKRN